MFYSRLLPNNTDRSPLKPLFSVIRSSLFIIFSETTNPVISATRRDPPASKQPLPKTFLRHLKMADVPEAVGLLRDSAENVVRKARRPPKLLDFNEMPDWYWYQDDYYITSSYRPISRSYAGSFASWDYLHDGFVNI
jgi:hypothetical protein